MLLRRHEGRFRGRGQAQVEFLLSVIALIFTIFWLVQGVIVIYMYAVAAGAAKEGVRCAVVRCNADIQTFVQTNFPSTSTMTVTCTPACNAMSGAALDAPVRVQV